MYRAITESPKSARVDNIFITDNNDLAFGIGDTLDISGDVINYLAPLSNLSVTLSSTSAYVTVLNNTINPGAMATLTSINTAQTPFTVKINNNAPVNNSVLFKLTLSDGTYTVNQFFSVVVNVDYMNININDIASTITSKGRLYYYGTGQVSGLGFTYSNSNLVYDGGLMIGNNNQVSDNCRDGANFDDDFLKQIAIARIIPSVASDFDLVTTFNDNNVAAANRLKVLVKHKTYAWNTPGDKKYIIAEYNIKNNGTTALSTLYAGICSDWDIQTYANNKADVDNGLKLGYSYCTDAGGLYAGTKLLTQGPFVSYGIDNVTGGGGGVDATADFTSAEKYTCLSTQRAQAGNTATAGNDVMQVVSTGPFNLAAGDSIIVAFALLAGDDLTDLQTSAANAQIKYDGLTTGIAQMPANTTSLQLLSAFPNPSGNSSITIPYFIPATLKETAEVSVLDVAGRQVLPTFTGNAKQGLQHVTVPANALSKGIYIIQLQVGSERQSQKLIIE
jgi:hypothetical protein